MACSFGSQYYILYGMVAGQSVVTYSANGKRLRASKLSFSIGHPNGITWDPQTRLCYVFKLGEIESAVVGNDGYLQLLINTMGSNTDYVWKTPLNVKELQL